MIPNIVRGSRMAGLMAYLAGAGRANEHVRPHLVAGDDRVLFAVPVGTELGSSSAFEVAYLLDQPHRVHGTNVMIPEYARDEHTGDFVRDEKGRKVRAGEHHGEVWHCSLSVEAGYGRVEDAVWEKIAGDFVARMGFIDPDGAKSSRWVAVHHGSSKNGNDHIHVVVQLIREDGGKANVHNDFHRAQTVCRELEVEYGLPWLSSVELGRGLAGEKPAERGRAERLGRVVSDKFELRRRLRAALATAHSADQYVENLLASGVRVAPSFAQGSRSLIRGYKVSLVAVDEGGTAFWYAPSKLDGMLGWPQVNQRFKDAGREVAEARLASLHNAARGDVSVQVRLPRFDAQTAERLMSHKTGPDTLANIYARVSMEVEQGGYGPLARLSENFARVSYGNGNAVYAARLSARFASRDSETGWLALLRLANRVARVMTQGRLSRDRAGLAAASGLLLGEAERIVRQAERRIQNTAVVSGRSAPVPGRSPVREYLGMGLGQGNDRGQDTGYER